MPIRPVSPVRDAAAICAIYNRYITQTTITFEVEPLTPEVMQQRIENISSRYPYFVYEAQGEILGYCYGGLFRERAAFHLTTETTVYLSPHHTGLGIGTQLYQELLPRLRQQGLHVAMACITLPNAPSVALHERLGFKKVAHLPEVGHKFERYIDFGMWQLIL